MPTEEPYDWVDDPDLSSEETLQRFHELSPVDDFFEEDEPLADVLAAWDRNKDQVHLTAPPGVMTLPWGDYAFTSTMCFCGDMRLLGNDGWYLPHVNPKTGNPCPPISIDQFLENVEGRRAGKESGDDREM